MRRALGVLLAAALVWTPVAPAWAAVVQSAAVSASGSALQAALLAPAGLSLGPSLGASALSSRSILPSQPTLALPATPAVQQPALAGRTISAGMAAAPIPAAAPAAAPVSAAPVRTAAAGTVPLPAVPRVRLAEPMGPSGPAAGTAAAPAAAKGVRERLTVLQAGQAEDSKALSGAGADAGYGIARDGFSRLVGEEVAPRPEATAAPLGSYAWGSPKLLHALRLAAAPARDVPPPSSDRTERDLRLYLTGTAVFKLGMDAMGLVVPLLALTTFGSAGWAAVFSAAWVLSQAVFSSLAGGQLDRRSPSKVLAWSMALQALAVGGILGLFAVDAFLPALLGFKLASPYAVLGLYALAGGLLGVSDTARQVIPPRLVGGDERALKVFNAKTHTAYETAGVASAFLAGLSISVFGLLPTLLFHPPAYLLAAFLFSRLKLGAPTEAPAAKPEAPSSSPARRALQDFLEGARTIFSDRLFAWSTLALIVPLAIHRLFEGLLLPVTAKVLLGNPTAAAWLLGASNLGELLGAMLLMKVMASKGHGEHQHSHFWARLMGLGLLALWSLALTGNLWLLLPIATLKSLTWAASDLSLRSKLQNSIPAERRGRAMGFVNSAAFLLVLASSLGLGFLLDSVPALTVLYGVGAAVTVIAGLMLLASRELRPRAGAATPPPSLPE